MHNGRRQKGVAISLILVAVALLIAISTAIMMSNKTNSGSSQMENNRVNGEAILAQARNIRAGIEDMTGQGIQINTITFDTSGTSGLYNPSVGGTEPQPPLTYPTYLHFSTSPANWIWKVDGSGNPVVKINGLGIDANADYVIIQPDLSISACYGVNQLLHGTATPPTVTGPATFSAWTTPATAIDLSAANATSGWTEGCFKYVDETSTTRYVYISPVRAQ